MTDSQKFAQLQAFSLAGSGAVLGATSLTLSKMYQIDGITPVTMTNFGTKGFGTLEPGNSTFEEQIVFTGIVQNANGTATLTGISTVLNVAPYTETSGLIMSHAGGVKFIITNTSGFYNQFAAKGDDESITGKWDFPNGVNNPTIGDVTYIAPTADTQIATKKYVDDTATGGATIDRLVLGGTAGETLAVGNSVYLKTADQRWWKTDATSAASSVGVELGFADSVATAGTTVNILIAGYEKNLTGLSAGVDYFLTNTPGTISTTAGTNRVLIGNAVTTTLLLMENNSTKGQLAGNAGTPSSINTLVTQLGFQIAGETYGASATGNDSYAITLSPAPTSYVNGMVFRFKADITNTGVATLNVNGLGAITIKKQNDQDLATGDIEANQIVQVVYSSTGPVFQMTSQTATPPVTVEVQTFTSSGTWTKTDGTVSVEVMVIGSGGGGGSGSKGTDGNSRPGGGGGGGGGLTMKRFLATALGASQTVTVGAGGAGGATRTASDGDGNDGSDGNASSFGTNLLVANGGSKGVGGHYNATGGAGGAGGVITNGEIVSVGGAGGGGSAAGTANAGIDTATILGSRGGGGGGPNSSSNTFGAGGAGGSFITNYIFAGGAGGATNGAAGTTGPATANGLMIGGVGAGGGAGGQTTTNGGTGGIGGNYGGGGGGGGGAANAATGSGAGGAGGGGLVLVISYF